MVDVTVKGAGIFGLSIAWACLKRGAKVQVVDPYGVGAGSSGGIVGALAPHVPENWNPKKAFQLESLLMAEEWWAEVTEASGQDPGYARTGRLQPLPDQAAIELAQRRAESAKALWGDHATWTVTDVPRPFNAPSPTGEWIYDTLSARLHPRQACAALATALGGVTSEAPPRGMMVDATGWQGLASLSAHFDKPVGNGVKGQSALFQYDARTAPQVFAETLHFIPHANGTVAIGSTSERDFTDPQSTDEALDALIAKARALMPVLQDALVIECWAGVRPRAKSRAPMLGHWPGRADHFIANGGFKIGFGMAPKVAEVMADLILEGKDTIPEGFRVEDNL